MEKQRKTVGIFSLLLPNPGGWGAEGSTAEQKAAGKPRVAFIQRKRVPEVKASPWPRLGEEQP